VGERIKEDVERFLKTLKLPINPDKSGVVKTNQLSFLGFTFRSKKIVWSDKALKGFKHRIRQLTNRTWSVGWPVRYESFAGISWAGSIISASPNITVRCPVWMNGYVAEAACVI
jgi:hypothetical protein